jgi:carbon storage regulator
VLVIKRKTDEAIELGEDISIMVLGIECNQVKIGIQAPKSIPILRREIAKRYPLVLRATNDVRMRHAC